MLTQIKVFIISLICLILPGCSNNTLEYYSGRKEQIDLRDFMNGEIEGWGAIFDYQGRQSRDFYVRIKGTWVKDQGKLEEWFEFDDGEKTERIWNVVYKDQQIFIADAKDVVGKANGRQSGNAVNMHYTLAVPYNNSVINLSMDDWMYKINNNIVLNRTSMKKFGFKVGEINLFMKKK